MKLSSNVMKILAAAAISTSMQAAEKEIKVEKLEKPKIVKCKFIAPDVNTEITAAISQLGHKDSKVRIAAVNTLEGIGAPAVPFLKAAAESKDPEIKQNAKEVLEKITAKTAVKPKNDRPVKTIDNCPGCGRG